MTELEEALSSLPHSDLPEPLAIVHVMVGRHLSSLIQTGNLRPRHCDVLNLNALYFSYGAPYYRPATGQTEDVLEFPIVVVFDAATVSKCTRFYPFDTGGACIGLFGSQWTRKLSRLDDLYVADQPERLVSCFYGTNSMYLGGRLKECVSGEEPLPTLHQFLTDDLSDQGVDQRHRTIECVAEVPIIIDRGIRWIAYPSSFSKRMHELWKKCSEKFEPFPYDDDASEDPASLVTFINKSMRARFEYMHRFPTI